MSGWRSWSSLTAQQQEAIKKDIPDPPRDYESLMYLQNQKRWEYIDVAQWEKELEEEEKQNENRSRDSRDV